MKLNWKAFVLSFVTQFILTTLIFAGVKAPEVLSVLALPNIDTQTQSLVNPFPAVDIYATLKPLLQKNPANFQLHKPASLLPAAFASGEYERAKAYIVADIDTGEVLVDKHRNTPLPIASITKLMTAVVALDLVSPEEMITVSSSAATIIPTKIGVVPGQKMTVTELLQAALLTSANDAVEVLRDGIDAKYGEGTFVWAMNTKAQYLGLKNTRFDNPQGFDSESTGNFSSTADLVILAQYALKNYSLLKEIVRSDYYFLEADQNHKQFDLYNWNGLLGVYPGAAGIKIGNTDDAGYTTSVYAEREGKRLVAVLLGAPGVIERDLWTAQILDLGFQRHDISPANVTVEQLKNKYSTWKYWQ